MTNPYYCRSLDAETGLDDTNIGLMQLGSVKPFSLLVITDITALVLEDVAHTGNATLQ